ncbi:hypothetical protein L6R52_41095, partial [Myxococcota bacterium]|nr:hypothetical protein [Myxococcota bacterium]
LDRVARALEAAGASAAVNAVPRGALEDARRDARARAHARLEPVPQDSVAARWIEASGLGARLRAAKARAKRPERFDALVARFVQLVDHACAAPSYCATRTGWHYPSTKADYLARRFEPEVVITSEERWEASAAAAERALERVAADVDPEAAIERVLVERFVAELGFDAARMRGARASLDAVVELVAHELLIPLRALNETLLDLDGEVEASRDERRAKTDALLTELLTGAPVRWDSVRSNSVPQDRFVATRTAAELAALCWGAKTGAPGRGFDAEPAAHWARLFPISQPRPAPSGGRAQPSPKE